MPKVSFIIPSYNSFKTISRTIESILELNLAASVHEILVIDCSDDEKTRQVIQGYANPKINLIKLSQKGSPAESRNTGAVLARGDVLCFIDSDVYLDEFWLNHVLEAYAEGCQIGGGAIDIPHFQKKNFLALAQLYLQFNEFLQTGPRRQVVLVPSCNMFVNKELFQKAGGFPLIRAAEDVLFCFKCAPHAPVWFVPQAGCFHIFRDQMAPYFQNQIILGKYIIMYRRQMYQHWYYQEPWSSLFLPLFVMVKITGIIKRIMKSGWGHIRTFILSFPLFLAGLFYWSVGFYQGAHQHTENL